MSSSTIDAQPKLLLPEFDVDCPQVSIVIPAVNERLTIEDFIRWCHEGLKTAGVVGEILIVDSSTDETPFIAQRAGARVLCIPKRGLGRAYIDAIPYIRAPFIIMGDADCTYDFRKIAPFIEAFQEGHEYVMGSRWLGSIEKGAMPRLHQYFGTPFTTWILNRVYKSKFTDIHCGMRGITTSALIRMGLTSQSWEYASELVLKSVRMSLDTVEVPVTFYKDRDGRLSHHKRSGWLSPFKAAWINLRAMFIYKAEFFALKPGLLLFFLGLVLTLPLSTGPIRFGHVVFNLYWMLLGTALSLAGLNIFFFGCLAQMFCDYTGHARERWNRIFDYTGATIASLTTLAIGLGMCIALFITYANDDFTLPAPTATIDHVGVIGVLLTSIGFSTFCFTLVIQATSVRYGRDPLKNPSRS
jgi:glycosyltransferase involved in cell wall biosynthesis